jgi:hypothetical protein
MTFTYQAANEHPPKRDRLRCGLCRRWTRQWVTQGIDRGPDPDATSRPLCDRCATQHRP